MSHETAVPQSDSALLMLPLEIRSLILKHVVTLDKPIPAYRSSEEPQKLHLDVLRTCKQLYDEGIVLFRQHNEPLVFFHIDVELDEPWVMDWHSGRAGEVSNISYNQFLRDSVPQFPQLRVYFSAREYERDPKRNSGHIDTLRKAVTLLDKLDVGDKTLCIQFNYDLKQMLDIENVSGDWIDVIAEMRCKKFSVEGVNDSRITKVIEVIEGRSNIPNLRVQCREVLDHFLACQIRDGSTPQVFSRDTVLERDLSKAARISKLAEYQEIRAKILTRCDELMEAFRLKHEELKVRIAST